MKPWLQWKPIPPTTMRQEFYILLVLLLCGAPNLPRILHVLSALWSTNTRELTWLTLETSKMFLSNKKAHASYHSFMQFYHKASCCSLHTLDSSTLMADKTVVQDLNFKDNDRGMSQMLSIIAFHVLVHQRSVESNSLSKCQNTPLYCVSRIFPC